VFALYTALFYGRAALHGNLAAFNRTMTHGYVAGDATGNAVVGVHLLIAFLISFSGALQLFPHIRARAPSFHRWNGRIFIAAAFTTSIAGLYMMWVRGSGGDLSQHLGLSLNGVLIMLFPALALFSARERKFTAHRGWALRLFIVVNGVWFFRIGLMLWLMLNHGPAGFDSNTSVGPFLTFLSFAQYLLPLAVLEVYLRTRDKAGTAGRIAMAAGLVVATAAMGVGIFGAVTVMWLPRLT